MRDSSRRHPSRARSLVVWGVFAGGLAVLPPVTADAWAQEGDQALVAEVVAGLPLREIGPAVMGGRIADIAIHPHRSGTWYIAVGSGGVWKTTNAGVTWDAIFEDQPVYSIGTVEIDPNHPDVVWVGTGENVSGRHVGWGDGVYRSRNGGETWENVGLRDSQHIGRILVDPRDSDVVLVAAEGSLWAPGGDRGVYKSTDGGDSWRLVLEIDENTGVTDIEFAPGNPDMVYAAAYERRRKIWGHLAGGPNSGIYKSTDGGESWRRISAGLPKGDVGKIGLAVTPANPEVVYATMEAGDDERGFYRSLDEGESWERRNSYISGGTGPHYYQEIEASPHDADVVYQMDVFIQVTRDGGATFGNLETGRDKHSDNHALWIDPEDGRHLLVGTDAGLYESFDDGPHLPALPEPAHLPVLQARARHGRTVLPRARRGAGPRDAVGAGAHDQHRGHPQPGLVRADGSGRIRGADRPAGPRHPLPADAAGEPLPLRPRAARRRSTSSPSPRPAIRPSASTGTRPSSSARTTPTASTTARSACGRATTAATRGRRSAAT